LNQESLFTSNLEGIYEKVCSTWNLREGFKAVKRNQGAPGIDGITIETFEENLEEELNRLSSDLSRWQYKPQPVKRVEIPKPDGGVRLLGIPCVRDRVVQATLKSLLEPLFEPLFSESSYGFRPGRNQEQAVKRAQTIVQSGKEYVVDIDLEKFFDRLNHDLLIASIGEVVKDSRVLRLIGIILRCGIMDNGLFSSSTEGSVQGGPLSPLLSNIMLTKLDKELEKRNLEFCRFADDCNIFVRTQIAGDRVMESVSKFIEKKLKLKVNTEKSKVALSKFVKFLGMTIIVGTLAISYKSMSKAMARVKELTPRGSNVSMLKRIERINSWYVGWSNYYKMTHYPSQLAKIEAHVRRRLRSQIIGEQKKRRHLFAKLKLRGVSKKLASVVFKNRGRWSLSHSKAMERAYPNAWFIAEMGQNISSDQRMEHWFELRKWIKLT
jgi:RNA-directed DNA polymerase